MSSFLQTIKCEYQHSISSTNGSISIGISIFGGHDSKKPQGQYVNGFRFQKKIRISHFFGQRQKSNTQARWISKMTQKGSALMYIPLTLNFFLLIVDQPTSSFWRLFVIKFINVFNKFEVNLCIVVSLSLLCNGSLKCMWWLLFWPVFL